MALELKLWSPWHPSAPFTGPEDAATLKGYVLQGHQGQVQELLAAAQRHFSSKASPAGG